MEFPSLEDDAYFAAIGRLTVAWSFMEAALDVSVIIIHHPAFGGVTIEDKRPLTLSGKLKFLKKAARRLPMVAPFHDRIVDICDEISEAPNTRHDMIHGFALEYIRETGETKIARILHGDPLPRMVSIKITTGGILDAETEARGIADRAVSLATELKDLALKTIKKPGT